jgi:hypothetical protein
MEGGKPVPVELNVEVNFQVFPKPATGTTAALYLPLRTAMPVLMASLNPVQLPFFRTILGGPATTSQPALLAQAAPAAQPAPTPQPAPVQPKPSGSVETWKGLTQEQQMQIDAGVAAAKRAAADTAKQLNSPEFRKRFEDAQRQAMEAAKRLDTPEFRRQMEDAKQQAMAAAKELNSAEFRKQLDDAKMQMNLHQNDLDSAEFRKDMEEVRRQVDAATEEFREAGGLANPPAK